eukprot:1193638-Rhodomonas_salina.2
MVRSESRRDRCVYAGRSMADVGACAAITCDSEGGAGRTPSSRADSRERVEGGPIATRACPGSSGLQATSGSITHDEIVLGGGSSVRGGWCFMFSRMGRGVGARSMFQREGIQNQDNHAPAPGLWVSSSACCKR